MRLVSIILQLQGRKGEARTWPNCRKAGVSHSNLRPKTSVHVLWRAPETSEGGCVIFRASVIASKKLWYAEDGPLTKKFCIAGKRFILFRMLMKFLRISL